MSGEQDRIAYETEPIRIDELFQLFDGSSFVDAAEYVLECHQSLKIDNLPVLRVIGELAPGRREYPALMLNAFDVNDGYEFSPVDFDPELRPIALDAALLRAWRHGEREQPLLSVTIELDDELAEPVKIEDSTYHDAMVVAQHYWKVHKVQPGDYGAQWQWIERCARALHAKDYLRKLNLELTTPAREVAGQPLIQRGGLLERPLATFEVFSPAVLPELEGGPAFLPGSPLNIMDGNWHLITARFVEKTGGIEQNIDQPPDRPYLAPLDNDSGPRPLVVSRSRY